MIPMTIRDSLNRYVSQHVKPGGFLTAVLENDLINAHWLADSENLAALDELLKKIYNEIPGNAWGSPEKVEAWLAAKPKEPTGTPFNFEIVNGGLKVTLKKELQK